MSQTTRDSGGSRQGAGLAISIVIGLVAVALAGGAGYWAGTRGKSPAADGAGTVTAPSTVKERKLLYYRNPMGLADTSPVPKKDPMGMDYIAVYEGDEATAGDSATPAGGPAAISISTEKIQKLGVRSEAAQLRVLDRLLRAAGRIEADERRLYAIAPKFEGYVERLHVNVTGQPVARGQPLFEVYSPELVSAQREYAIAVQGVESLKGAGGQALAGMQQLAESSLARLRNWDISDEQVQALAKSGEAKRTLTFRSPVGGVVTEKKALQGMRFMPGDTLYQIADLSSVWVIADVPEQDIAQVRTGARAKVRISAYPDKVFEGRVGYIYPTLTAETRSVPVRIEMANRGGLLKPAMFAQVDLPAAASGRILAVPVSAVLDSGTRQMVLVRLGEGRFAPREVRSGARDDNYIEILDGLKEGEEVVTAANFLIDAESNLKAAVSGFSALGGAVAAPVTPATTAPAITPPVNPVPAAPPPPASARSGTAASPKAGYSTIGTVEDVDAKEGTVMINHAAIASLKWPAMSMEFKVANASLLKNLKTGARVQFEFVQRQADEWVITRITPVPAEKSASGAANAAARDHSAH